MENLYMRSRDERSREYIDACGEWIMIAVMMQTLK